MKHLLFILLLFCSARVFPQLINFRADEFCLHHNSAIISKVMMNIFGEDSIEQWLSEKAFISFTVSCDSMGLVNRFISINQKRMKLTEEEILLVEEYIKRNKISFCDCLEKTCDYEKAFKHAAYIDSLYSHGHLNEIIINVSFPGILDVHSPFFQSEKTYIQRLTELIVMYIKPTIMEEGMQKGYNFILAEHDLHSDTIPSLYLDIFFFQACDWATESINGIYYHSINELRYILNKAIRSEKPDLSVIHSNREDSKSEILDFRYLYTEEYKKQVASLICEIAVEYVKKHKQYDAFPLLCVERVLEVIPNHSNALFIKKKSLLHLEKKYRKKYKHKESTYINMIENELNINNKAGFVGK